MVGGADGTLTATVTDPKHPSRRGRAIIRGFDAEPSGARTLGAKQAAGGGGEAEGEEGRYISG